MNKVFIISLGIISLLLISAVHAAETTDSNMPAPEAPVTEEGVTTLAPVTVVGQKEDSLTIKTTLDRRVVDRLPSKNGSLNELLSILPGVQLSDEARTSESAGEILPSSISISGGRFYENSFLVDGIGNNSLLDPAFDLQDNRENVPGHPQQLFIDPSLIDTMTLYRSNIPARYDGFTGGVVDVETRQPAREFGGFVHVRTTNDDLTEMHIARENEADFDYSNSEVSQPRFDKFEGTISMDIPLSEKLGALVEYSRTHSDIPLYHFNRWSSQERDLENWFAKLVWDVSPDTILSISGTATPYEGEYFLKEQLNSDYRIRGGGYSLTANLDMQREQGLLEFDVNWRHNRNDREAPAGSYLWRVTDAKNWGALIGEKFSKEGGYGDIEKSEESLELGAHFTAETLLLGESTHGIAAGATFETVKGTFDRTEPLNVYSGSWKSSAVDCEAWDNACVDGEQFMFFQNYYSADSADARIDFWDGYVEDQITWKAFSVRPGVHISYNDLNHNLDIAPRLAMSWDIFNNKRTVLIAGANRYYGKTLLTHALAEEKTPYDVWRRSIVLDGDNHPQPWYNSGRKSINTTRLADLETPYSDELTLGIRQQLLGGELELLYIKRNNEDELAITTLDKDANNLVVSQWNNNGSTNHEEATLSWAREWQKHSLHLNVTWQETETSHHSYIEDFSDEEMTNPIWFRGEVIDRSELPRPDFNREVVANLVWTATLPYNLTFTNVTKYRSGYDALDDTGANIDTPLGRLDVFDEVKHPESWLFDWKLDWERALIGEQSVVLHLEVNNVFNQKVASGPSVDVYDLGRQFWLGMTYHY